jgi:hypothetical protein
MGGSPFFQGADEAFRNAIGTGAAWRNADMQTVLVTDELSKSIGDELWAIIADKQFEFRWTEDLQSGHDHFPSAVDTVAPAARCGVHGVVVWTIGSRCVAPRAAPGVWLSNPGHLLGRFGADRAHYRHCRVCPGAQQWLRWRFDSPAVDASVVLSGREFSTHQLKLLRCVCAQHEARRARAIVDALRDANPDSSISKSGVGGHAGLE